MSAYELDDPKHPDYVDNIADAVDIERKRLKEEGPMPTTTATISPEQKAFNAAFAKAQGEFPAIPKDKTVAGKAYSYAYTDLASILAAIRPVLAKHGFALMQRLEQPNGKPALRTELMHAEGEVKAASFPLGELSDNMQQFGSRLTYIRRYAVQSILGIAAEEDDDGRQAPATKDTTATVAGAAEPSPFQPPDLEEGKHAEEDLSSAQRKKIFAIKSKLTQAGLFDDDTFKGQLLLSFGVDSISGLTKDQASELITRLLAAEEKLDAA